LSLTVASAASASTHKSVPRKDKADKAHTANQDTTLARATPAPATGH